MVERLEIIWTKKFIHNLDGQLNLLFKAKKFNSQVEVEEFADKTLEFVINEIEKGNVVNTPEKYTLYGPQYIRYMVGEDDLVWYIFFEQRNHQVVVTQLVNNDITEVHEALK